MKHFFLLLIVFFFCWESTRGTPIPRNEKQPLTVVGTWDLQWGTIQQVCTFTKAGEYSSPNFGNGGYYIEWNQEEGATILFTESGRPYRMLFDKDGNGIGNHLDDPDHVVTVKFTRRK